MPNRLETLISDFSQRVLGNTSSRGNGEPRHSLFEDRPTIQKRRLVERGISLPTNIDLSVYRQVEKLTDKEIEDLGVMITDPNLQGVFFGSEYDFSEARETLCDITGTLNSQELNEQSRSEKLVAIRSTIEIYVAKTDIYFRSGDDYFRGSPLNKLVRSIGRLVIDDQLFSLFGSEPELLASKVELLLGADGGQTDMLDLMEDLVHSDGSVVVAKALLESSSDQLEFIRDNSSFFKEFPEAIEIYNEFCKSGKNWGDKYTVFRKLAVIAGCLPLSDQSLSEAIVETFTPAEKEKFYKKNPASKFLTIGAFRKKVGFSGLRFLSTKDASRQDSQFIEQSQVARHINEVESEDNPILTMGLSASLGFEIEFPYEGEEIEEAISSFLQDITESLGVHWGDGGMDCFETAPGPFNHPDTMVAYFDMMGDLGFIDLYRYKGLTFHFNPGVEKRGLAYLILGQYLGNTLYSTDQFSQSSRENGFNFRLYGPRNGESDNYMECKSFSCITPHETRLGMVQIGYLSWALKAYQNVKTHLKDNGSDILTENEIERARSLSPYVRQLAIVWSKYAGDMTTGVQSVGLDGLFKDEGHGVSKRKLNRMIYLVDEAMPSYRDRFTDPHTLDLNRLNPVTLRTKSWPSVVAFSRDMADQAVNRVRDIERRVKMDTKRKIVAISRSKGNTKKRLIRQFILEVRPHSLASSQAEMSQEILLTANALGLSLTSL